MYAWRTGGGKAAICREDSKRIFEAHHAQLKAQTIDVLQETLENKKKGMKNLTR